MKTEAFFKGYEDKKNEIRGMGFNVARDKLNIDYPVGQKWTGSKDGFDYMQGEAQALHESIANVKRRRLTNENLTDLQAVLFERLVMTNTTK